MPTTEKPVVRIKPTRISLENPLIISDAVSDIMDVCGGDCFGFGYPYRKTPEGIIPLFSVYRTTRINKDENGKPLPE